MLMMCIAFYFLRLFAYTAHVLVVSFAAVTLSLILSYTIPCVTLYESFSHVK